MKPLYEITVRITIRGDNAENALSDLDNILDAIRTNIDNVNNYYIDPDADEILED